VASGGVIVDRSDCSAVAAALAPARRALSADPALLLTLGGLALGLGLLVYAADRAWSPWISAVAMAWFGGSLFGALSGWLPSAVHPFAFSLFTAAFTTPSASPAYRVCAAWWAVNVAFELGQHPRLGVAIASTLYGNFGHTAWVRALAEFFLRGRFDVGDLVAATLGALAAAAVLRAVHQRKGRHAR
jgi:hypothetical protein